MKYAVLIVFLAVTPFMLFAQNVSSNSTVEECIAYIDQVAKKNKISLYTFVDFGGTTFTATISERNTTEYDFINWASFSKLRVDASHQHMTPSVKFIFQDSILRKTLLTNSSDEILFRDFHTVDGFMLNASKEDIPLLEIAAKRLAQLAKQGENELLEVDLFFRTRPVQNVLETKELISKQIIDLRRKIGKADEDLGFEMTPNRDAGKFKMNIRWNARTKAPEESIEIYYRDLVDVRVEGQKVRFESTTKIVDLNMGGNISEVEMEDLVENLHHWLWLQGKDKFSMKLNI